MLMRILAGLALFGLVACSSTGDLEEKPEPLGDFAFGHNIVVANNMVKGPVSRDAEQEEWVTALKQAIGTRFDRYEGDRLYHFGVSVQGFVLAKPGLPVVASPKSVLILNLDVWDDAKGVKMNAEPKQLTVLERMSGETFIGSGLTQSKEVQMKNLSENAARLIKNYLERQHAEEGWFVPEDGAAEAAAAETAVEGEAPEQEAENATEAAAAEETATETSQQGADEATEDATDA